MLRRFRRVRAVVFSIPAVKDLMPEFHDSVLANSTAINAKNYKYRIGYFLKFAGNDLLVTDLTPRLVDQYVVHMKQKGYKPATQHNRVQALQYFEKFLFQRYGEYCKMSFSSHIKIRIPKARPGDKLPNLTNVDRISALAYEYVASGEPEKVRDGVVFFLISETGIRRAECAYQSIKGMQLNNQPRETQLGNVYKAVLDHAKSGNTNPDSWEIHYTDKMREMIMKWLELRPSAAKDGSTTDRLFVGLKGRYYGKPLTPDGIRFIFERFNRVAGIERERVTCHQMRHLLGQRILDKTGNLELARKILRHSDIKLTSSTYVHQDEKRVQTAVAIISSLSELNNKK